ncbi:XF1762 family protein [Micromonospora sp. NBC_01813]|uniref:XF1762 family protein n=1 Tax=Micromonospora sp. NBC_01813 TaxID=2975988 RepID=UPI002DDA0191|nr:XF1762 family protein [Micromonospora sp. NBC_01813]WSA07001.1 hypothetical protein OG958_22420 [Micromonospora sp. NBC_01813]
MTEPTSLNAYQYRKVGPVELYLGDTRQVLAAMADASVDCIVTSPPFWGQRDYGTGAWNGGDPACPHPLGRTRRTDGTTCPVGRRYLGVDINAVFHDEALTRLRPHLPDDTAGEPPANRAGYLRRSLPLRRGLASASPAAARSQVQRRCDADQDDVLVGVAVVGRPVARLLDDGLTLEVTRVATDGTRNANSLLYAAAWQAARALGYRRLVTYTQDGESGASLRASGWRIVASRPPQPGWSRPSRPRVDHGTADIARSRWEPSS